jgi:D-alanyl-lipoteichoic acid acyltransferase DltB (MBOAT superfamily)
MILGLTLTVFLYVMAAALFRLLLPFNRAAALGFLAALGAILIYAVHPLLAAYFLGQLAWTGAIYLLCRRFARHATALSWLVFAGLLPANVAAWTKGTAWAEGMAADFLVVSWPGVAWTVGSAFFVIRTFVAMREGLAEGRIRWMPMLAGLTFVPAFSAGPIFGTQPFREERIADKIEVRQALEAIMKLGWGAAALYVIAPSIREYMQRDGSSALAQVADTYLGLAALYFDFSGYTLMAIAMAALCGVSLPENFNRPYLARSIREFWQRWHMSLSWFVGTYLFKPFVRRWGKPRLGIFLAFTIVGIWHELSLGYLMWGLGHGAALSLAMKPPAAWSRLEAALPGWAFIALCWLLTITWVALLSRIANGL